MLRELKNRYLMLVQRNAYRGSDEVYFTTFLIIGIAFIIASLIAAIIHDNVVLQIFGEQMVIITYVATTILLLSPLIIFWIHTANYAIKYSKTALRYLPQQYLKDKGARIMVESIRKAFVCNPIVVGRNYTQELEYIYKHLYMSSPYQLDKNNLNKKDLHYYQIYDVENTTLWIKHLNDTPYLERISLFTHIETYKDMAKLKNRDLDEIDKIFYPFSELYEYIYKIHNDRDFRIKELKKEAIIPQSIHTPSTDEVIKITIDDIVSFAQDDIFKPTTLFDDDDDIELTDNITIDNILDLNARNQR